jgi:hypothetical protein
VTTKILQEFEGRIGYLMLYGLPVATHRFRGKELWNCILAHIIYISDALFIFLLLLFFEMVSLLKLYVLMCLEAMWNGCLWIAMFLWSDMPEKRGFKEIAFVN